MTKPNDCPPIDCVGVICLRGDDVLLVRRGSPPKAGEWSIPGGRIEPSETQEAAAHRELLEETGITAELVSKIAVIEINIEGFHYNLHDYVARWVSGAPIPGDDALEARFVPVEDIGPLNMWPKTCDVIRQAHAACKN